MGVTSGKTGAVSVAGSAVSSVAEWTLEESVVQTAIAGSNTAAGTINAAGVSDWKGSFRSYGRVNPLDPGATGAFLGYTGGARASGNILVTSIDITADLENLTPLACVTEFEGNGALTYPATTAVTDGTSPLIYVPSGGKVTWEPIGQSAFTLAVCRSWNLKVTCESKPYTTEASGWRSKLSGKFAATASASIYEADLTKLEATATYLRAGTNGLLKLYVDGSNFFGITYANVTSIKPITPIEGADPVGIDVSWAWTAFADVSGTVTRGSIAKPVSGSIWS